MNCKNCGSYVAPGSTACPACGTPTEEPAKKSNKKLLPIIVAIALVVAIIAGAVGIGVTSTPEVKVLTAFKKTVFSSSELNVKVSMDYEDEDSEDLAEFSMTVGDDINSSTIKVTEDGEEVFAVKDGKVYSGGEEDGNIEELLKDAEEGLEDYLPEDTDLVELVNGILNNKIDEKAIKKAYDDVVVPALEKVVADELDEEIEIPSYDDIFGTVTDIFKSKEAREALGLEKIKSDLPGTTYEYNLDVADLAEAALTSIVEDKQYEDAVNELTESADMEADEMIDYLSDMIKDVVPDITGTITVKSGRLTNFTLDIEDGATLVIEIESKK